MSRNQEYGCFVFFLILAAPFLLVAGLMYEPRATLLLTAVVAAVWVWELWGRRWWQRRQLERRKAQREEELRRLREQSEEKLREQQGRGESRPDVPGAQEGVERPWWRRVFGG